MRSRNVLKKKALLRCLIDKIALHRLAPDRAQARIIWVGGETITLQIQAQVKRFAALSGAREVEQTILKLAAEGISDEGVLAVARRTSAHALLALRRLNICDSYLDIYSSNLILHSLKYALRLNHRKITQAHF